MGKISNKQKEAISNIYLMTVVCTDIHYKLSFLTQLYAAIRSALLTENIIENKIETKKVFDKKKGERALKIFLAISVIIAVVHSIYNILTAILLFNFIKFLEKSAIKLVPDKKGDTTKKIFLDERLLNTPTLAISESFNKTIEMAELVHYNFITASKMLKNYDSKKADEIRENEMSIDAFEDYLNAYLLKLSGRDLTETDNNKISQVMLAIGDIERIGDHATHILKYSEKLNESDLKFSEEAVEEIKTIVSAVQEIYEMALECYKTDNLALAQKIEPLEAVIKKGVKRAKNNHIHRLQNGQCNPARSFIFSDLLNDLRRVAAHCGNIATSVIQLHDITINKHEYNHRNKDEDMEFKSRYKDYKSRYKVPKKFQETNS